MRSCYNHLTLWDLSLPFSKSFPADKSYWVSISFSSPKLCLLPVPISPTFPTHAVLCVWYALSRCSCPQQMRIGSQRVFSNELAEVSRLGNTSNSSHPATYPSHHVLFGLGGGPGTYPMAWTDNSVIILVRGNHQRLPHATSERVRQQLWENYWSSTRRWNRWRMH